MDILETQLHQKKQNPSYADGFWGQEKAAKIQSHHSPEARDSLRGPEINRDPKMPKPEVRPLRNTTGTPGPASSPHVTACPAAAARLFLGTQHRDSESLRLPVLPQRSPGPIPTALRPGESGGSKEARSSQQEVGSGGGSRPKSPGPATHSAHRALPRRPCVHLALLARASTARVSWMLSSDLLL